MDPTFDDEKLFSYTDSELINFISLCPTIPEFPINRLLSPNLIVKGYSYWDDTWEDAKKAQEVAAGLGVRVPRVRRVVSSPQDRTVFCISDRVRGSNLHKIWPMLGWFTSIFLAFQLRNIIRRLRTVTSASAGSLATGKCRSFYFEDTFGLPCHANIDQVYAFLNFWASFVSIKAEIKKTPAQHAKPPPRKVFPASHSLVLTHHDMVPQNLIVGTDGQLWIVDWEEAGFYPAFFEYAGLHNFLPTRWSKTARWRWDLFAWIAGGHYYKVFRRLERIRFLIRRFRPARRFNMKANGYAAVAGRIDDDSDRSSDGVY